MRQLVSVAPKQIEWRRPLIRLSWAPARHPELVTSAVVDAADALGAVLDSPTKLTVRMTPRA